MTRYLPILGSSILSIVALSLGLSAEGLAQPATPQKPASARTQDEVIRISTDLVQTDITVLDKHGRFVEGLQLEQFQMLLDGKHRQSCFRASDRAAKKSATQQIDFTVE